MENAQIIKTVSLYILYQNFSPVTSDSKFILKYLCTNSIFNHLYQNFTPITDLENQLNSISEDYGLSLGTHHPPTHPTLVIIERKGF